MHSMKTNRHRQDIKMQGLEKLQDSESTAMLATFFLGLKADLQKHTDMPVTLPPQQVDLWNCCFTSGWTVKSMSVLSFVGWYDSYHCIT